MVRANVQVGKVPTFQEGDSKFESFSIYLSHFPVIHKCIINYPAWLLEYILKLS